MAPAHHKIRISLDWVLRLLQTAINFLFGYFGYPAKSAVEISHEVPTTCFVLFEKLPKELQCRIWWFVCQEPRIIDVGVQQFKTGNWLFRDRRVTLREYRNPHVYVSLSWHLNPSWSLALIMLASPILPPAILHVSKAARESALFAGCYRLITIDRCEVSKKTSQIYVNPGQDFVHLDRAAMKLIEPNWQNYRCPESGIIRYRTSPYPGLPSRFDGLLSIESFLCTQTSNREQGFYSLKDFCWGDYLRRNGAGRKIVGSHIINRSSATYASWATQSMKRGIPDIGLRTSELIPWTDFFGEDCVSVNQRGYYRVSKHKDYWERFTHGHINCPVKKDGEKYDSCYPVGASIDDDRGKRDIWKVRWDHWK